MDTNPVNKPKKATGFPKIQNKDPFATDPFMGNSNRAPRTQPREIGAGVANKPHGVGDNRLVIDNAENRITLEDEAGIPRMIIGTLPDNTIGIAISKVDTDVNDAFA